MTASALPKLAEADTASSASKDSSNAFKSSSRACETNAQPAFHNKQEKPQHFTKRLQDTLGHNTEEIRIDKTRVSTAERQPWHNLKIIQPTTNHSMEQPTPEQACHEEQGHQYT